MEDTKKKIEKFYIHFEQDEHYMPIDDYEKAIKTTKAIFENITKDIIKTNEVNLVIYAPKEGGVVIDWGFVACVIAGQSLILQFLDSPTGKHIIKKMFNKTPIELINNGFDKIDFVKALVKAIFTTSQDELKNLIDEIKCFNEEITQLDKSLKAVSDFYKMCNSNKQIKAIGFVKEYCFPISKKDFYLHMTNDIYRDKGIHKEYKKLTIVKPVTKRDSKNKWTLAETGTKEEQSYTMDDIIFKEKTLNGDFVKQNSNDDQIIALIEYKLETKNGIEKPKDRKIIEIYEFNEKPFENRNRPEDFELNNAKKVTEYNGQIPLFNNLNNLEEQTNA